MIAIAYAAPDKALAERLASDLTAAGYPLGEITGQGVLIAVISPEGILDKDLNNTIQSALRKGTRLVLVESAPTELPPTLVGRSVISMANGHSFERVQAVLEGTSAKKGLSLKARNRRIGIIFGVALLALFGVYTWMIAVFDIEAPVEDFQRAYTHSAATVGMFAQPFVPRTTEEALNFETTLESREVSDELATVIVQTVTQAATIGGYTPIPTGLIIAPAELSVVRQTATGGAIIRATETAQAENDDFDAIAATATQAAVDADAQLQEQLLTVTAAAEDN
jgi:hypothetical protein